MDDDYKHQRFDKRQRQKDNQGSKTPYSSKHVRAMEDLREGALPLLPPTPKLRKSSPLVPPI